MLRCLGRELYICGIYVSIYMKISAQTLKWLELLLAPVAYILILSAFMEPFPLQNFLLNLVLTVTAMFYLLAGLLRFSHGTGKTGLNEAFRMQLAGKVRRNFVFTLAGVSIAVGLIGIWQVLLLLPMARITLYPAFGAAALAVIFSAVFYRFTKDRSYWLNVLRCAVFMVLFVVFITLPPYYWIEKRYAAHPEYIELLKKLEKNPQDTTLLKMEQEMREAIILEGH